MAKQKKPEIDYSNAGAARVAIRAPSDSAGFRASVERTAVAQTASADAIADHVDQAVDPDPHTQYAETADLGTAATLDVGTTAGTVAAGDDSRFVTGGDSHDHSGGDGAQIAYSGLSGLPTLDTVAAPVGSVNFNDQQATSFRIENRTSDPAIPTVGQIWVRTDL